MKIAIILSHMPSKTAHSINTMKHAQGFFELGHEVIIIAILGSFELDNMIKIGNLHDFYGINHKIKVKFFLEKSPLFFKDSKRFRFKSVRLSKILRDKFPKLTNILEPSLKISQYCKKKKNRSCLL